MHRLQSRLIDWLPQYRWFVRNPRVHTFEERARGAWRYIVQWDLQILADGTRFGGERFLIFHNGITFLRKLLIKPSLVGDFFDTLEVLKYISITLYTA